MKVLISAYACEPNKGSEPYVGWNWIANLSKHCQIIVITRSNNREPIELAIKELIHPKNVEFIYTEASFIALHLKNIFGVHFYNFFWQRRVYRLLKSRPGLLKDVDILHQLTFNGFREPGYLWKFKKPFIWGPIGGIQNSALLFSGLWGRSVVITLFRDIFNSAILRFSYRVRAALKAASVVFVANTTCLMMLPTKYDYKYKHMLETGVNLSDEFSGGKENSSSKFKILWCGNLNPNKGLLLALNAAKQLQDIAVLTVVGNGRYMSTYKKYITKHNINNVNFVGKIPYAEVSKYYSSSDVFLFTSLRDTSGNVVLEAMLHELPVIAINHHGAADMLNGSRLLVDATSPKEMVSKICILVEKICRDSGLKSEAVQLQNFHLTHYTWTSKAFDMYTQYGLVAKK